MKLRNGEIEEEESPREFREDSFDFMANEKENQQIRMKLSAAE